MACENRICSHRWKPHLKMNITHGVTVNGQAEQAGTNGFQRRTGSLGDDHIDRPMFMDNDIQRLRAGARSGEGIKSEPRQEGTERHGRPPGHRWCGQDC